MNELHLFAGCGGGILGGILLGHTCVCAVEIEAYRRSTLLQRQRDRMLPGFPIWDDVRTFDGTPWRGNVDCVCGGFPCQDISSANTNAVGITGPKSGLWKEYKRIVKEIKPTFVFIENSQMLRLRGLDVVLEDLAEIGYDATWDIFSAAFSGADHIRKRMFILAYSNTNIKSACAFNDEASRVRENAPNPNETQCKRRCVPCGVHSKHTNACGSNWWKNQSRLERVADGMAHRVERLEAIGDGQVPVVAARAFLTLLKRFE
jgi:DNA (cytosine-5)-methyltransferase 1